MEDLIVRLCIKEDSRRFKKKGLHSSMEVKTNFMKHDQGSKTKITTKRNTLSEDLKEGSLRTKRFKEKCFKWKMGHKCYDYKLQR